MPNFFRAASSCLPGMCEAAFFVCTFFRSFFPLCFWHFLLTAAPLPSVMRYTRRSWVSGFPNTNAYVSNSAAQFGFQRQCVSRPPTTLEWQQFSVVALACPLRSTRPSLVVIQAVWQLPWLLLPCWLGVSGQPQQDLEPPPCIHFLDKERWKSRNVLSLLTTLW